MLGGSDFLRVIQEQGAINNPPSMQLGTMTSYNTCMLGDELELQAEQLYFFDRDTKRQARTVRPPEQWDLEEPIAEGMLSIKPKTEKKEYDRVVYSKPYQEGDTVALIEMPDGRYLVMGKITAGEKVKELDEQINMDWAEENTEEEA